MHAFYQVGHEVVEFVWNSYGLRATGCSCYLLWFVQVKIPSTMDG